MFDLPELYGYSLMNAIHTKATMEHILSRMDLWYQSALGASVLAAERAELGRFLPNYFGGHLVQLGGSSEADSFSASPIIHRLRFSPEHFSSFHGPSVRGNFTQLPFLPNSIDVIVAPHVLEFVSEPEEILQQISFALAPGGHIVIFGFNPFSLWGVKKACSFKQRCELPWLGTFWSASRIVHWLKQAGFVVTAQRSIFFRPPLVGATALRRTMVLEALGRLLWSNCGAVYLIVAEKRVAPLVPLTESGKRVARVALSG